MDRKHADIWVATSTFSLAMTSAQEQGGNLIKMERLQSCQEALKCQDFFILIRDKIDGNRESVEHNPLQSW